MVGGQRDGGPGFFAVVVDVVQSSERTTGRAVVGGKKDRGRRTFLRVEFWCMVSAGLGRRRQCAQSSAADIWIMGGVAFRCARGGGDGFLDGIVDLLSDHAFF